MVILIPTESTTEDHMEYGEMSRDTGRGRWWGGASSGSGLTLATLVTLAGDSTVKTHCAGTVLVVRFVCWSVPTWLWLGKLLRREGSTKEALESK